MGISGQHPPSWHLLPGRVIDSSRKVSFRSSSRSRNRGISGIGRERRSALMRMGGFIRARSRVLSTWLSGSLPPSTTPRLPCALFAGLMVLGRYVDYVMHRVRMLKHFGVTPYLVFDGDYLPSKAGTEAEREKYARTGCHWALRRLLTIFSESGHRVK
jgi:hypothetical protein